MAVDRSRVIPAVLVVGALALSGCGTDQPLRTSAGTTTSGTSVETTSTTVPLEPGVGFRRTTAAGITIEGRRSSAHVVRTGCHILREQGIPCETDVASLAVTAVSEGSRAELNLPLDNFPRVMFGFHSGFPIDTLRSPTSPDGRVHLFLFSVDELAPASVRVTDVDGAVDEAPLFDATDLLGVMDHPMTFPTPTGDVVAPRSYVGLRGVAAIALARPAARIELVGSDGGVMLACPMQGTRAGCPQKVLSTLARSPREQCKEDLDLKALREANEAQAKLPPGAGPVPLSQVPFDPPECAGLDG